eukprot:3794681-Amphidinium_carterae.1
MKHRVKRTKRRYREPRVAETRVTPQVLRPDPLVPAKFTQLGEVALMALSTYLELEKEALGTYLPE